MKYFKPPRLFNQVKVFDPNVNSTVVRSKIVTFLIFCVVSDAKIGTSLVGKNVNLGLI